MTTSYLQTAKAQMLHPVAGSTVIIKPVEPGRDGFLDFFTAGLLIATAALAIYTAKLRKATLDLAGDTVEGNKLADQHHQESLSPICVLQNVRCGRDAAFKSQPGMLGVKFSVVNIGGGPAVIVNVNVQQVGEGLKPKGSGYGNLAYALAPGQAQEHTFGNLGPPSSPTYSSFLVKVEFLTIFNTWGNGQWTVQEGDGVYFNVSFDMPKAQPRVGVEPQPGPLSSSRFAPPTASEGSEK